MTTTILAAAVVPVAPVFTEPERLALAGFLASYTGLTCEAYTLDLRQYASWCQQHHVALFAARRADIECFARDLEARGRARSTVSRRVATIAGFYKYAVQESLPDHSPAAHVRRPRLDYESHAVALDRNEVGALLVAAGLSSPAEHALVSLLALNGLRVSEAVGADIEALSVQRGHRTLAIIRKGSKKAVVPLAPRTARAIDLTVGERCQGPIFLTSAGQRLDRHGAGRIVRRIARRAGLTKPVGPHTLRHAFITAALDAGVPLRDVQEAASHADPRTGSPGGSRPSHFRHRTSPCEPHEGSICIAPYQSVWPSVSHEKKCYGAVPSSCTRTGDPSAHADVSELWPRMPVPLEACRHALSRVTQARADVVDHVAVPNAGSRPRE